MLDDKNTAPSTTTSSASGNIIMVTDGVNIPDHREWRLINAWSLSLGGAICALLALCFIWPDPYL
ncbi:MAG: hypothetical protein ACI33N_00220, partial [Desulfovibrionaceae bacterium]